MRFEKVILILFSNILNYSLQSAIRNINPEFQQEIDDFIENVFLPYSGVSGLGLAVVKNDGELLYTTGYGYSDHENGIRNGNQTQFLLGSVTKSFTAVVVVKALHEHFPELGEAVLDTPIRKLMPEANFILMDRVRTEHATFRDLLSHKMCIPRDDFQLMTQPFSTTADILYRQRYAKESCGFRSRFMYNNHMVLMASELIGHLQNQSFELSATQLMKEIGMFDSAFAYDTLDSDSFRLPLRAKPYYVIVNVSHPMNPELITRLSNLQAIGGLYVTPNDMARFIRFQLNMGNIDGKQVIPEQVMSWLTKPSSLFPTFIFKGKHDDDKIIESPLAYGLGLMISSYDGWQRISHNGYFTPFRTEISWYPALSIGIFTSTHEAPTNVNQQVLHSFIVETLQGNKNAMQLAIGSMNEQKMRTENEEIGKRKELDSFLGQRKNEDANLNSTIKWDNLIGKYGNDVSGEVEISKKYNPHHKQFKLYLSYGKWAKGWLEKINEEVYQITWDTDLVQDYYAGGDKEGLGYVLIKEDGALDFVRPTSHGMMTYAQFQKGVTLKDLLVIPWMSNDR